MKLVFLGKQGITRQEIVRKILEMRRNKDSELREAENVTETEKKQVISNYRYHILRYGWVNLSGEDVSKYGNFL